MPRGSSDRVYDDPEKILKPSDAWRVNWDSYWKSKTELIEPYRDKWQEYLRAYKCYFEQSDDAVFSNYVKPTIYSQVESFVPRTVGTRPRIEVWGREPGDDLRAAMHRALIFYQWDLLNMPVLTVDFVKAAQIYGTAWMKMTHRKERRTVPVMRNTEQEVFTEFNGERFPTGFETVREMVDEQIVYWDDPWIEVLDLDEVFPDPHMKSERQNLPIVHRTTVSLNHLEMAEKRGEKLYNERVVAQLKKRMKEGNQRMASQNETLWEHLKSTFGPECVPTIDPHRREVTVLERWTHNKVVTTVEEFPDLDPIRNERNEYGMHPFVRYTPTPVPNDLYGIGKAEVLYSNWREKCDLSNARMDHVIQNVHEMKLINPNSMVNPMDLEFRAGGWLYGRQGDITPLEGSRLDFSVYREQQELDMDTQKATGGTDTFAGLRTANTGKTATEATLLSQAAGSRANLELELLGSMAFRPLGRLMIRDNELNLSEPRRLRILGDEITRALAQFQAPAQPGAEQGLGQGPEQGGGQGEFTGGPRDLDEIVIDPEVLASGSGVDLDVTIDIASAEPENRQVKLAQAVQALGPLGQLYAPNDPLMLRLRAEIAQGLGFDFVTDMAAKAIPAAQQQPPPGAGPPGAGGTLADLISGAAGGNTPSTGDAA